MVSRSCLVCLEDNVELAFRCHTKSCRYEMCAPCVKHAFEDSSGANSRFCPMCQAPTARNMVESMCGKGAIREVERNLRSKVEYEVRKEKERKSAGRALMSTYEDKAQKLFLEVSEWLNMKCPRCKVVFDDYDGCNALTCSNPICEASFCSVCLQDCGTDAHPHALSHGNLFDKNLFLKAKAEREEATLASFLQEHAHESFEVKELVKIKAESISNGPSHSRGRSGKDFLAKAKATLQDAVRKDRLSVLSESGNIRRGLTSEDISPRNRIPENYQLCLISRSTYRYQIRLRQRVDGVWRVIPLPEDEKEANGKKKGGEDHIIVDALSNARRSLQSCSIAFAGADCLYQTMFTSLKKDEQLNKESEISVNFSRVDRATGAALGEGLSLQQIQCEETTILGFNANKRMLLLEQHVEQSSSDLLMFDPLRQFVGEKQPGRLLRGESALPAPDTFKELNKQQQLVAHPLSIRTAMECAGPPGTGKTKTITELVRSILYCTEYDVIILSERNGAIDAIAEKMAGDCIHRPTSTRKRVKDFVQWKHLLSFGSAGMGSYARLFTSSEKLGMHPELEEYRRLLEEKDHIVSVLKKAMLKSLASRIEALDPILPRGSDAVLRSDLIAGEKEADLCNPSAIVHAVSDALEGARSLSLIRHLTEKAMEDVVLRHSSVLGHLIPIFDSEKVKSYNELEWSKRRVHVLSALERIVTCLQELTKSELFDAKKANECQLTAKEAQENHMQAKNRIQTELVADARVLMATIGSSHQLPVPDNREDDLADVFDRLDISSESGKDTVVVFDEAGCIPAYELLGLSRLKRSICALVCVGDKHQLPPYTSGTMVTGIRRDAFGRRQSGPHQQSNVNVDSLLDVCALSDKEHGGKIRLTSQYRVPRDIANVLNDRIYKGYYHSVSSVPNRGFSFVNVDYRAGKKYENENEIQKCVDLVLKLLHETPDETIMVLTPYKKQQRRLQFEFKKRGYKNEFPVLSIDQCQGQEADNVILSLVQRPTRFLNKNRFNVALSRVRKRLFLLTDRRDLQEAARNTSWECALMAKDLLQLARNDVDSDDSDGDYDDCW